MPASIAVAISRAEDRGFGVVVGEPCDSDAAAGRADGDERLRAAAGVVADAACRGVEDLRAAAVVAAQHDLRRARVRAVKLEEVVDVGAAPAVQQLVVVAGDDERSARRAAGRPGEAGEQPELSMVGVLELVDDDVAPATPVPRPHDRVARQQRDAVDDEVVEVKRVRRTQLAVDGVPDRRDPLPIRMLAVDAHRVGRPEPALRGRDLREHIARLGGGAVARGLVGEDVADHAGDVVRVVDAVGGGAPEHGGVRAHDAGGGGVERRDGDGGGGLVADERGEAHAQLLGRADGERQREDLARLHAAAREERRDARGEDPGLAGAGAGEHQQRAVAMLDDAALLVAERGHARDPVGVAGGCGVGGHRPVSGWPLAALAEVRDALGEQLDDLRDEAGGERLQRAIELAGGALVVGDRSAAGGGDQDVEQLGVAEARPRGERADALAVLLAGDRRPRGPLGRGRAAAGRGRCGRRLGDLTAGVDRDAPAEAGAVPARAARHGPREEHVARVLAVVLGVDEAGGRRVRAVELRLADRGAVLEELQLAALVARLDDGVRVVRVRLEEPGDEVGRQLHLAVVDVDAAERGADGDAEVAAVDELHQQLRAHAVAAAVQAALGGRCREPFEVGEVGFGDPGVAGEFTGHGHGPLLSHGRATSRWCEWTSPGCAFSAQRGGMCGHGSCRGARGRAPREGVRSVAGGRGAAAADG